MGKEWMSRATARNLEISLALWYYCFGAALMRKRRAKDPTVCDVVLVTSVPTPYEREPGLRVRRVRRVMRTRKTSGRAPTCRAQGYEMLPVRRHGGVFFFLPSPSRKALECR